MFILIPGRRNPEVDKLVLMVFVFGLFIASTVVSCDEVRYAVGGRTQRAAVEKAVKITHAGDTDDSSARVRVSYGLQDGGGTRHESDEVSMSWMDQNKDRLFDEEGKTVEVQYLAGSEDNSRLSGHSRRWVMAPFALAIVFLVVVTWRFWGEYSAHQRRMAAERD